MKSINYHTCINSKYDVGYATLTRIHRESHPIEFYLKMLRLDKLQQLSFGVWKSNDFKTYLITMKALEKH